MATLECLATLEGHTGPVRTLAVAGGRVFSGSYDKTVRAWDADTLRCAATLVGHSGAVRALVAADGGLFSGSDDTTIKARREGLGGRKGDGEDTQRKWRMRPWLGARCARRRPAHAHLASMPLPVPPCPPACPIHRRGTWPACGA